MVTRLISATGDEIKEMSPMDLKESIFKSEGRVVMVDLVDVHLLKIFINYQSL